MHHQKITVLVLTLIMSAEGLFSLPGREHSSRGELRFGVMSEPVTLDPLSSANTADGRSVLFNIYEGLVKPDTAGRLLPAVSESFEISQGGLVYSFILREGLRFHDGSPVKAEDVEFSLNEAARANFLGMNQIEKITLSGDRKIEITLKSADPDFLPYLTIGIVPKNNPDREQNPVGTGPFKIDNYKPQQSLTFIKNPDYWQPGLPRLEKVTLLFSSDSNALYTGLEGGNFEGAMVTSDILEKLDQKKYHIVESYTNSIQLLALNNRAEALDDIRVRQALNYAVDIKDIINTAFYGRGEPSGSPLIPGLSLYYNEDLRDPYPVNLAKARALLEEAGYGNGFNLEIKVPSNYVMHVDTAQVLVNQLAKINVRVNIRLVDWATWLSDVYRNRNYEATIISLDSSTISPQGFLGRYVSSAPGNFLNFRNEGYDNLYREILEEQDESRRILLYREAQKIISDEAAAVFIQDIFGFKVFSGGFRGAVSYPLYVIDFSTIYRD